MILYQFLYCPCICESEYCTISIHKTPKGAYTAMRKDILKRYNEWFEWRLKYGKKHFKGRKFDEFKSRTIGKIKLEQ